MRVRLVVASLVLASAAAAAALAPVWRSRSDERLDAVAARAARPVPSIFCEFYDFMHKTVVASYDFAIEGQRPSTLALRAQVSADGTDLVHAEKERPRWSYALDDGTPAAVAPDGDTRILFFGLKPERGGVAWSEAGVRNSSIRNLEGRCRQAYLDQAKLGAPTAESRPEDALR